MQTYYLSKKNIKKYRSLARANDIVSLNLVWKDTVKALKMTGSHSDRNAKFDMIWQSDARGYTADVLPDGFGCVCSCYSVSWESLFTWNGFCDFKHNSLLAATLSIETENGQL